MTAFYNNVKTAFLLAALFGAVGGPLSYLAGNRAVWALRREAEAHVADQLSGDAFAREFHRVYLDAGSMPVSRLRTVFADAGMLAKS